jgi:diguanylate cyclase (GGDEF)-like protein/PAS domain S-box-containing protein
MKQKSVTCLVVFAFAGMTLLVFFSILQKMALGVPLLLLKGYTVPILFGSGTGLTLGIWYLKLQQYAERLAESESRFRVIFERVAVGIAQLDLEGHFLKVNQRLCAFLGYSPGELLGLSIQEITDPRDLEASLRLLQQAISGEIDTYNLERRYKRRDGTLVWGQMIVSLVRSDAGVPLYFISACKDITERKQAELDLRQERDFTAAILNTVASLVIVLDRQGRVVRFNRSCEELTGYSFEEVRERCPWDFLLTPENREEARDVFNRLTAGHFPNNHQNEWVARDGRRHMIDWANTALIDAQGEISYVIATGVDITERVKTERELLRVSENNRLLLDSAGEGIFGIDSKGDCTFVNRAGQEMLGFSHEELLGKNMHELTHHTRPGGASYAAEECPIRQALSGNDGVRVNDEIFWRKDGSSFPVEYSAFPFSEESQITGAVVVFRNVADNRAMVRKMDYLATHDSLTGLANRYAFERRLRQSIEKVAGENSEHVLCYLDLDQFKVVNDTCGHVAGDELLRQLSTVLHKRVRQGDTLGRLGGDEFGVLLENCPMEDAMRVVDELRAAVQEFRFVWEKKIFSLGVSIGTVAINAATESVSAALSKADTACYAAKEAGRNRVHVYEPGDVELVRRHGEMQWVSRIHQAFEDKRFFLRRQRIAIIETKAAMGQCFEILIGLRDRKEKMIPPGAFLPAAERFNLMPTMDRWVIRSTLEWLGGSGFRLDDLEFCTINLSGTTLADESFLVFLIDQINESPVPPAKLCFEITETAAIANLQRATLFMSELKQLGCRFALDDFGSGMSSFAYLKNLPVDFLKIDGTFVRDIKTDEVDRVMVEAINKVGHVMGLQTMAEHVEDEETLDILKAIRVDYAQGYHLGVPEPVDN